MSTSATAAGGGASITEPDAASPAAVQQAIQALELLFHSSDTERQREANAWLLQTINSTQAWSISMSLLSSFCRRPEPVALEVLSFAVNTLYTKCRSEWNQLPVKDRHLLQLRLLHFLLDLAAFPVLRLSVLQRLANTIGILATRRGKGGCRQLAQQMMDFTGGLRRRQQGDEVREEDRYCVLLVLTALAEEGRRVKVSWSRQSQLQEEMGDSINDVFSLALDTVTAFASPSTVSQRRLPVLECCMELLIAWQPYLQDASYMLTRCSDIGLVARLLDMLRSLIAAAEREQRLIEIIIDVLCIMIEADDSAQDDEDRMAATRAAMEPVYAFLHSLQPLLRHCNAMCGAAYIPAPADSAPDGAAASPASSFPPPVSVAVASFLSHRFALLLDMALRLDPDYVCSGLGHSLSLINSSLAFASYPFAHRSTTHTALNLFVTLQDSPVHKRHRQLRQPLFSLLVRTLLSVLLMPAGFRQWDDRAAGFEGEREEWESYVEDIGAVLGSAFPLLREEFVTICLQHLEARGSADWTVLSSVVVALTHVADSLQSLQLEGKSTASITAALVPLCRRLLHLPSLPPHPVLRIATCRLLSALHFWLPDQRELLEPAVSFLIVASPLTPQAGTAFSRLMVRSGRLFAAEASTVESLLSAVVSAWGGWPAAHRLSFCSGLTQVLQWVTPSERGALYLQQLLEPIVQWMAGSLQAEAGDAAQTQARQQAVMEGLTLVDSVVGADTKTVAMAADGDAVLQAWQAVVLSMLEAMWDLLLRIERLRWQQQAEDEEAKEQLCRLYGHALGLARDGPYALSWMQRIVPRVAACYDACPNAEALSVLEGCCKASSGQPAVASLLLSLLPSLMQTTLSAFSADPAGQVAILGHCFHFLSVFCIHCRRQLTVAAFELLAMALDAADGVLEAVDDGYAQLSVVQFQWELLLMAKELDEQQQAAWRRLWSERAETCTSVISSALLSRGRRSNDRQSDASAAGSSAPASADDGDDESGGPSPAPPSSSELQRFRHHFAVKAAHVLHHLLSCFQPGPWQRLEAAVSAACSDSGWGGEDRLRVLRLLRCWLVEERRWCELMEDVRRLVGGEEMMDVLLGYELAWQERERKQEETRSRLQGLGSSRSRAILLTEVDAD